MTKNNQRSSNRNIWNLVLGIAFLGYGIYRTYTHVTAVETDTFGLILAVGFIAFGVYDLYKYFKGR